MNLPHCVTHWIVYERAKKLLGISGEEDEFTPTFAAAGFAAGACAAFVSTPFDVVKTELQLQKARHLTDASRNIWLRAGIRGFMTGAVARIGFIAPSAMVLMSTYEAVKFVVLRSYRNY